MERYARANGLFLFEVVVIAWEALGVSGMTSEKAKELLYLRKIRDLSQEA